MILGKLQLYRLYHGFAGKYIKKKNPFPFHIPRLSKLRNQCPLLKDLGYCYRRGSKSQHTSEKIHFI